MGFNQTILTSSTVNATLEINVAEDLEDRINPAVYVAAAFTLGIIGFFGFTLNLLVAVIIISDPQALWTPVNIILLNMVIGDFLVAAIGNPLAMASAITGGWYWDHEICLWYAWFMSTLGLASICNLTVMAVERWLLVTRPMKALSLRHAGCLALSVWLYALCLSLPPLLGWGSYGPEAGNVSCSVSWEVHDPATNSDSYIAFLFVFGLVIPVIVISASYASILRTLKKVKKRAGSRGRREAKVTKMVALMIIAFLVAWSPYATLALAAQYFHMKASPAVAILPALLAKSSICYNPVIYAGLNAQFPRSLKKRFGIRESTRRGQNLENTTTNMTLFRTEKTTND
ncbi:rhodopsin-like isoform X1 [Prorops nasuta]|uniref:rhodopsin-like isoform X1 n=1 Tax=Prorops nasuta TaxID=863751 RepID=UPI0034CF1D51